jgi:hypothetical protein
MTVNYHGKQFYNIGPRCLCYKNTVVPSFSRVEIWYYITALLGIVLSGANVIKQNNGN